MGLTNTVVLRGKSLEDDVLVLSIRGSFWWIARVETVPEAVRVVQIVVGVLAGAHPRACHPDVLRRMADREHRSNFSRKVAHVCCLCPAPSAGVLPWNLRTTENAKPAVVKKITLYRSWFAVFAASQVAQVVSWSASSSDGRSWPF